MTPETAQIIADAINSLGAALGAALGDSMSETVSTAINAGFLSLAATLVNVLVMIAVVAAAFIKHDAWLYILAGISVTLYAWGQMDSGIAGNTILQNSPLIMLGLYLIVSAGVYAFQSLQSKHQDGG
ncbi:hypothetical protein B1773_00325 [Dehalococcoides mccartyi]|jgi:hypothetical protein|uniref:Uncharacterized protein n=1 Tax=Dehalococcoides mccartyi TaxID=61435 RepID=A0A2J1DRC4_9CHLR|nr:hypothetical protein [Dehalococcoides mccartyi]AQU02545.1 hypothetical protein B1773_00325 [Dehalococcoides mccartyi]PKH44671.1 hypothetical protein CVH13_01788 [Dehalococcoides mccartyi]